MSTATLPKIQHYVPRFLLRNFATGKKAHVWAYDKWSGKQFRTNVKNVAAESGFYDLETADAIYSLEPGLEQLDTRCSEIIKEIVRTEKLSSLSMEDRATLATFAAAQKLRTAHLRESMLEMDKFLQDAVRAREGNPEQIENYHPLDEEGARILSVRMVSEAKDHAPHFLDKHWILLRGRKQNPFYISDNPIALQNLTDHRPRGNLGLRVDGIEIYLPLGSTLTLAMYCPSLTEKLRDGYASKQTTRGPFSPEAMIAGLEGRKALTCFDDNILNLNFLQVVHAERQIYCRDQKFSLVKDMLNETSDYKVGPRIQGS